MKTYKEIQESISFKIYNSIVNNIFYKFYPFNIINKENVYNGERSCIYIGRHSTHNWELILGLFTFNKHSCKIIRGLGHYIIFLFCPWYILAGVVIGTRKLAQQLIDNNEYLFILPGGGEEMTFGSENANKTFWISKSKKYKTGFAKLAYDNNIPVIPVASKNVEYMLFQPFIIIANLLYITKLYEMLMNSIDTDKYGFKLYHFLFYFKMWCTSFFGSMLVIPIPQTINIKIGKHIYKNEDEDVLTFAKRCENELNTILQN